MLAMLDFLEELLAIVYIVVFTLAKLSRHRCQARSHGPALRSSKRTSNSAAGKKTEKQTPARPMATAKKGACDAPCCCSCCSCCSHVV